MADDSESSDILADLMKGGGGGPPLSPRKGSKASAVENQLGMSGRIEWDAEVLDETNLTTMVVDDNRFTGKVIIVTGAGGQLGREGCRYFARRGARIAALDRSKAGLRDTYDIIAKDRESSVLTFDFKPYLCDVTNEEQIAAVLDSIYFRFGKIDYLWNNAGYQGKIKPLLDNPAEDFKNCMDINVTGAFIMLQAVARKMVQQESQGSGCAIVNTGSVAGQRGTPCMIGYAASKAAVHSLTITAAKELAQYNIRVNTVAPALIGPGFLWERQNKLHAKAGPPYFDEDPDVVAQNKINAVPLKRLGTPEEVIKCVAFLFGDDSSYMTGSTLTVDGGMAAMMKC